MRARLASEALNGELERELAEKPPAEDRGPGAWPRSAEAANRAKTEFLATMSHEIPHAAERRARHGPDHGVQRTGLDRAPPPRHHHRLGPRLAWA
ncbi:hypothetical protein ACRAWD_05995 [Caulobacter segnis]